MYKAHLATFTNMWLFARIRKKPKPIATHTSRLRFNHGKTTFMAHFVTYLRDRLVGFATCMLVFYG